MKLIASSDTPRLNNLLNTCLKQGHGNYVAIYYVKYFIHKIVIKLITYRSIGTIIEKIKMAAQGCFKKQKVRRKRKRFGCSSFKDRWSQTVDSF
jgi:hypothetical protein